MDNSEVKKRIDFLKNPLLEKAERLWYRMRVVAVGFGLSLSSVTSAVPAERGAPDIEKKPYDIQNVMPNFAPSSNAESAVFPSGIEGLRYEKNKNDLMRYIHSVTLEDLRSSGLIEDNVLKGYAFQAQDFGEMSPQKISRDLQSALQKTYPGTPSGKCMQAVRELLNKVTGCNIYSPTGKACGFSAGLEKFNATSSREAPVISCGFYGPEGNISKEALYATNGCLIVYDGHEKDDALHSAAGHIGLHFVDKNGEGFDWSDGKQKFAPIVEKKIGGQSYNRYGKRAEVYIMTDVHPSCGLAEYLAKHILEKTQSRGCEVVLDKDNHLVLRQGKNSPQERPDFQNTKRIAQAAAKTSFEQRG